MRYKLNWLGVADDGPLEKYFDTPQDVLMFFAKLNWVENIIEFSRRYESGAIKNDHWGVEILDTKSNSCLAFYVIDLVKPNKDLALDHLNFYATYNRDMLVKSSWFKWLISGKEYSKYRVETEVEQIRYNLVTEILEYFLTENFSEVSKLISYPAGFGNSMV